MATLGISQLARLGRYELLARLATGGMGEIFLARLQGAAGFEKLFVVKRILPHLADDARFRQMLIAEARIAAKMSHANICQVYELGETDGQLYIVMEYLDGVTMLPFLRKASRDRVHLDFGFVAALVQQVCDALHYAHELKERGEPLGLVHRDVTPSNIFLTESGVAKVLDFGIAKAKGASTNTQEGTVKGKYAYMAPEQLRGGAIDRRVDVFALGVVLYEMLALRRLFQRKTDYLTFRAVMEQPIPDVRRYREDVPESLCLALARALDRDPSNRFDTARQFASVVLDAVSPLKRPWTQGEIGDFVHANFAEELGQRNQQIASAIQHTASGAHADPRATMPLVAHTDSDLPDDGLLDIEFPPVETEVEPIAITPPPARTSASVEVTPPPFAADSASNAVPQLKSPPNTTAPVVVVHQRSLLWPLVAVAGIAIAAVALFLVWKQMQDKPPIIITGSGSEDRGAGNASGAAPVPPPTVAADAAVASAETIDAGVASPPPGNGDKPHQVGDTRPLTPEAAINRVIERSTPAMKRCVKDHLDRKQPDLPDQLTIRVTIVKGKARQVSVEPSSYNAAPVGACIRDVLLGVDAFPKVPGFSFELRLS
jgi:serine/threonine-protein kinase